MRNSEMAKTPCRRVPAGDFEPGIRKEESGIRKWTMGCWQEFYRCYGKDYRN